MKLLTSIVVILSLFFAQGAKAQSYYLSNNNRTFDGGLVLGTTFSQIDGDNFKGYHKVGITGGGIVYAKLAPMFAPSIELLYIQKGSKSNVAKFSGSNVYFIQDYGIDLNYAEMSVLLNYYNSSRQSHFGGGVSYSQLISGNEYATTKPTLPDSLSGNLSDVYEFRKYDINIILSGSLHVYKGLFVNLRFQYSALPIRKDIFPYFGRVEQYNNSFVLRAMYLF